MRKLLLAATLLLAPALARGGEQAVVFDYDGSFEDAAFELENAIIDRGLVVDHVSQVGEMLNRTAADVGSEQEIFERADVYLFCSAVLSREVMEADPLNIAHCPYGIFLVEQDGAVKLGFRDLPDGPMQKVERFLEEIVRDVAGP